MEAHGMADYFADESMMGYITSQAAELAEEIKTRYDDLQIVDAAADPVIDADLLCRSSHDNDIIIGMLYAAQTAISDTLDILRMRRIFPQQQQ